MVLYRPRASSYDEAMKQLKIFDNLLEVNRYIIQFHNLYNLLDQNSFGQLLTLSRDEKHDTRNGWLHSRYIFMGNILLGILDAETLFSLKKPQLTIYDDSQGGLRCQFTLLEQKYSFFLGMDQWTNSTQCQGFRQDNARCPIYRMDNVDITHTAFTQILYEFIARQSLKFVRRQAPEHKQSSG